MRISNVMLLVLNLPLISILVQILKIPCRGPLFLANSMLEVIP